MKKDSDSIISIIILLIILVILFITQVYVNYVNVQEIEEMQCKLGFKDCPTGMKYRFLEQPDWYVQANNMGWNEECIEWQNKTIIDELYINNCCIDIPRRFGDYVEFNDDYFICIYDYEFLKRNGIEINNQSLDTNGCFNSIRKEEVCSKWRLVRT